jgi:ABC-2 type transport system permease protein
MTHPLKACLLVGAGGRGRWSYVLVGFFGIVLPLGVGRQWIDSPVSAALPVLILVFLVASLVADTFAGERERHTLETLLATRLSDRVLLFGKILAIAGYAWLVGVAITVVGLATLNLAHPGPALLLYPAEVAAGSLALSLLLALLVTSLGVLISLRASSVRQVQQIMGTGVLVLVWIPILAIRDLPAVRQSLAPLLSSGDAALVALMVGGTLVVLDAALLAVAMARFQRARLSLS